MKFPLLLLLCFLVAFILFNINSIFFHKQFFWSPASQVVNIATPVLAFIYLLLYYLKERKREKRYNELIRKYTKRFTKSKKDSQ